MPPPFSDIVPRFLAPQFVAIVVAKAAVEYKYFKAASSLNSLGTPLDAEDACRERPMCGFGTMLKLDGDSCRACSLLWRVVTDGWTLDRMLIHWLNKSHWWEVIDWVSMTLTPLYLNRFSSLDTFIGNSANDPFTLTREANATYIMPTHAIPAPILPVVPLEN